MVITIECPTCTASFPVDTDKIPEAGVSARCSECGGIFRVERPPEPVAESVEASLGDVEPVEEEVSTVEVPEAAAPEAEPYVVGEAEPVEVEPTPAAEDPDAASEPEPLQEIELPYIEVPDSTAPVGEGPVGELPVVEPQPVEAGPVAEGSSWDDLLEAVPIEEEPADVQDPQAGAWDDLLEAVPTEADPEEAEPVAETGSWDSLLEAVPMEDEPLGTSNVWDTAVEVDKEVPEAELPEVELPEAELPEVEQTAHDEVAVPETPTAEVPTAQETPVDVYIPAPGEGGVEMPDIEDPSPEQSAEPDDWVVVMEGEHDLGGSVVEPVGTVEQGIEEAIRHESITGDDLGADVAGLVTPEIPTDRIELESPFGAVIESDPPAVAEPPAEVIPEPPAEVIPEPPAEVSPEPTRKPVGGFTFGKRDPDDKARRLARVLVSDMIMYNPERHEQALSGGTLKEDFEEEITKSWKEYVEQVGGEMAAGTTYWTDALNEVLAKGQPIF